MAPELRVYAPTSPWMVGPFVIMLMFLAGNGLATERAPDGGVSISAAGWAQTLNSGVRVTARAIR